MVAIETVLVSVLAGALYGFVFYARNRFRRDDGREAFQPAKFGATIVVSAVIGGLSAAAGSEVDYGTIEQQIALYAGAVALCERALKMVWDRV